MSSSKRRSTKIARISFTVFTLLFFAWLAFLSGGNALGRIITFGDPIAIWTGKEERVFDNNSIIGSKIFRHIRTEGRPSDRFLIYRQAEFAYYLSDRRWIYDIDNKFIDMYDIKDEHKLYRYLKSKGLSHVFMPNYMPATLYNSTVQRLIGDPAYSWEILVHSGYRLIKLADAPRKWRCKGVQNLSQWQIYDGDDVILPSNGNDFMTPGRDEKTYLDLPSYSTHRSWWKFWNSEFKIRGGIGLSEIEKSGLDNGSASRPIMLTWSKEVRERIMLTNNVGPLFLPSQWRRPPETNNVHFYFRVKGNGYLEAFLLEYDKDGGIARRRVWDAVLKDSDPDARHVKLNLRLLPDTVSVRLTLSNGGFNEGFAIIAFNKACFVEYLQQIPEDNIKRTVKPSTSSLSASQRWLTKVLPKISGTVQMRDWDYTNDANWSSNSVLRFGTGCHIFEFYCPVIPLNQRRARYFVQPIEKNGQKGIILGAHRKAAVEWFTGEVDRGIWTWIDYEISEWLWFFRRSVERSNRILRWFADWIETYLPNAVEDGEQVPYQVEISASARFNTQIIPTAYWRDKSGSQRSYFLGPKQVRAKTPLMKWQFPLPKGATELEIGLIFHNKANQYSRIHLRKIAASRLVTELDRANVSDADMTRVSRP